MLRYKEIKRQLLNLADHMSPGEKLPSRLSLCKKLDTNRRTLDKAIGELCVEGVFYSVKGSGTFINAFKKEIIYTAENWGLILPNVRMPVFANIAEAIESFANSKGINLILCNSDEDIEKQEGYIQRLSKSPISGFIMIPVVVDDIFTNINVYTRLLETKIPLVFCSRVVPNINVPVVMINNFYGGYIATKHLLDQGYHNIAFIAIHDHNKGSVTKERCQGYISALMESDIPVNYHWILAENEIQDSRAAYERIRKLLKSSKEIDAIFGSNDETCKIVYQAIKDSRLKISDHIGVIGFDNTLHCMNMVPPLSSLTYNGEDIGSIAAEILWNITQGTYLSPDYPHYFCKPQIVCRESCMGPIHKP
jgi:DNA-binding LacI/PurR family transcriptional regulator